jgi:chromosomal replication initiator protein
MLGLGIQTQTILFQLFDFLTSNNKQIVITSDKPASSLVLMDRLKSRFEGSLNVDIKSPDYQQRMEILKYKVKTNDSIEVPDNVIEFIAQNFNKNVRELEGALKKVQADSYILGLTPNLDTAKESLVSLLVNKEIVESIDITKLKRIQTEVANTFSITVDELIGKKRNESYTLPRHIAIYLMREKYNLTYKDIARLFGGRDHSTIISSIKNIERLILTDQKVKETIDIINRKLQE